MLDKDDDFATGMPALDLPLTDQPQTSYTLPASWYTDPAIFQRERHAIFYRSWQYVGHKGFFRKPGDYMTARICDQNVFVMMGGDGVLRGFYNVCKHRAHELLQGPHGNVRSVIVCPYHAWTFEREGGLRGARFADERPGFDKADYALSRVRVEEFCNCIFVNLDDGAASMAGMYGEVERDIRQRLPFLDDLEPAGNQTDMLGDTVQKAGWKVVVDNYVECYHCQHAHPDFASLICMDTYQTDCGRYWSRQVAGEIRHDNSAYKVDPADGYQSSSFWYLWPNTTFNILPGGEELAVFAIRPIDPVTSSFEGHMLTTGKVNQARCDYTAAVLAPEDIALCESVQRGLMSKGYSQGPIITGDAASGQGEQGIHHFHRLVYQALAE